MAVFRWRQSEVRHSTEGYTVEFVLAIQASPKVVATPEICCCTAPRYDPIGYYRPITNQTCPRFLGGVSYDKYRTSLSRLQTSSHSVPTQPFKENISNLRYTSLASVISLNTADLLPHLSKSCFFISPVT